MKSLALILSALLISLSPVHAAGEVLELRLVKFTGEEPTDKTLRALVNDTGAQASEVFTVPLAPAGETEIKQLSPYRYPTEFTMKGDPDAFEVRDLGWKGQVSVISADEKDMQLKLDISNCRIGSPHIYDTKGVQTYMPNFSTVQMSVDGLPITRGEWKFLKIGSQKNAPFLAIRVADTMS